MPIDIEETNKKKYTKFFLNNNNNYNYNNVGDMYRYSEGYIRIVIVY